MDAYTGFAGMYDEFMQDTPYEKWLKFITETLKAYGINGGLALDLGCGTGTLTEAMAEQGFDMIGIDLSEEMLRIAMEKKEASGHDILYLCQDMCEFELYGTVGAVICMCDSINYLTEEEDVAETFRLVNNYLDPSGIFIFDFNTVYKYETVIGDTTIAENREDCSFIWENYYDPEEAINEYEVTFFQKEGELYRKFTEVHYQKGYIPEQVRSLLQKAGLKVLEMLDEETLGEVREETERVLVVAMEQGKAEAQK